MKSYLSLYILLFSLSCFAMEQIKMETKQEFNLVWAVTKEKNGTIWYSTSNGLVQVSENKAKDFTIHNSGLLSNQVRSLALDRDGSKWIATNKGVSHWDDSIWHNYTKCQGLISNNVSCVAIDKYGKKWFGTDQGISLYDGKNWKSYTRVDGLVDNFINTINFDWTGRCWVGTSMGISVFDGSFWQIISFSEQANDNFIKAIEVDSVGHLWFQSSNGIRKFDGNNWTYFPCNGLIKNCIAGTQNDPLWNIVEKIKTSTYNLFDLEVQNLIQETISGNSKLMDIDQLITYPNQKSNLLYINKMANGRLLEILTPEGQLLYMRKSSKGDLISSVSEGFYAQDKILQGGEHVFAQKIYLP